jgi:competence protein ComEC
VIDVCNAKPENTLLEKFYRAASTLEKALGNFNQKEYPVNPISYLKEHGVSSVFRFVSTHPDMDHLDGLKLFFETFSPTNFWDTDNIEEKEFGSEARFDEDDWLFYKDLRDGKPRDNPKRLTLFAGDRGQYWNINSEGKSGADGLYILAPTLQMVNDANSSGDYNDCSYVILYRAGAGGHRIVFSGDSHDKTWEHILENHLDDVTDIDVLIAPHHGRASGRSYDFLDILRPKITLFGNARSEHLAYGAWNYRGLPFITNNQAGSIILNAEVNPIDIYVTHQAFAQSDNPQTFYSDYFKAYYYGPVK